MEGEETEEIDAVQLMVPETETYESVRVVSAGAVSET